MVENMMGPCSRDVIRLVEVRRNWGKGSYTRSWCWAEQLFDQAGSAQFPGGRLPWLIVEAVRHWGPICPRAAVLLPMAAFLALALRAYDRLVEDGQPDFPFQEREDSFTAYPPDGAVSG